MGDLTLTTLVELLLAGYLMSKLPPWLTLAVPGVYVAWKVLSAAFKWALAPQNAKKPPPSSKPPTAKPAPATATPTSAKPAHLVVFMPARKLTPLSVPAVVEAPPRQKNVDPAKRDVARFLDAVENNDTWPS